MKRIGILGGTFDPVHNAHIELAQLALEQFELDTVLFIPAGMPVRKLGKTHASPEQRLEMLRIACEHNPQFEVSTIEIDSPEISYTINTLKTLTQHYGSDAELFLILGEDTVTDLGTWKDSAEIAKLVTVLYARRPGGEADSELPQGFLCHALEMKENEISSSAMRTLLQTGEDVSNAIPAKVLDYIREHGLYGLAQ